MNIKIISTEGYALPAVIEVDGVKLGVMDNFSMMPSESIDPSSGEFSYLEDDDWGWDQMFQGNPDKEMKLVQTGDWSYDAYGQIKSINPVIADFGIFSLDLGEITNDERCIGEWIQEKVTRLDFWFNSK